VVHSKFCAKNRLFSRLGRKRKNKENGHAEKGNRIKIKTIVSCNAAKGAKRARNRIKAKSIVSRRGAGTQRKAKAKEKGISHARTANRIIKAKSSVSRRARRELREMQKQKHCLPQSSQGTQRKARTKEHVSRNGAAHATKKQKR
jgi:hypothetical protein